MPEVEFVKNKYSSLDGRTKVMVTLKGPKSFCVQATPSGVELMGPLSTEISDREELDHYAQLVAEGWKEHIKLIPKISRTLSGH